MALEDYMLPCVHKSIFGIDCFGCGIQRSLALILEGEFRRAFYMYPPIYTLLLFFFFVVLSFVDKKRNYGKIIVGLGIINAVIMVVSYFMKNPLPLG